MRHHFLAATALGLSLVSAVSAFAGPIAAGFNSSTLPATDDGSTGSVAVGFTMNFFGTNYNSLFVNNNGNVTFSSAQSAYDPFGLTGPLGQAIIAPFFADVDTEGFGSGVVSYGTGTYNGHNAFGVNWPDVGYYNNGTDKLNAFQLVLVDRSDLTTGDFDIYFNYDQIQWDLGDVSDVCAVAGYSNGTGNAGTFSQLTGSAICGAFLDGGVNALASSSNNGVTGQFLFEVRNGEVQEPPVGVPEPITIAIFGAGLVGLGLARRRSN